MNQDGLSQLSGSDTSMLRAESVRTPNHFAPIGIYDQSTAPNGLVTFKQVLAFVASRLDQWPNARRRLVHVPFGLDRPYWADDPNFDLEFHVRHISLPRPGDWRQLAILLARIGARPLDLARAPWEMYVIGGLDDLDGLRPGCFAVMLKVHAAAVDVLNLYPGLAAAHATRAADVGPAEIAPWQARPTPSRDRLVRRALSVPAARPAVVAELARPVVRTVRPVVRDMGASMLGHPSLSAITRRRRPRAILPPRTRFNARLSPHRVLQFVDLPAADVDMVRSGVPGARLETVALAVIGGALRGYLLAHDELPSGSLTALVPLAVTAADDRRRLLLRTVALGTGLDSPLDRLRALALVTGDRDADGGGGVDLAALSAIGDALPGVLTAFASRSVVRAMNAAGRVASAHTIVSAVAGPTEDLYLAGARLVRLFGFAPLTDGIGLVNSVAQVGGTVSLSVTADRVLLPDPALYGECLREAFADLRQATSRSRRRRA